MLPRLRRSACTKASPAPTNSREQATAPMLWRFADETPGRRTGQTSGATLMLIETCLRIGKCIARRALATAVLGAMLAGCASAPAPQSSANAADYKGRAVTRTDGGVRVSAVTLSADESAAIYGVPLAKLRIQPVWIE